MIGVRPGAVTTKQRGVIAQGSYWLVQTLHERVALRRVVAVSRVCPNCRSTIYDAWNTHVWRDVV